MYLWTAKEIYNPFIVYDMKIKLAGLANGLKNTIRAYNQGGKTNSSKSFDERMLLCDASKL